MSGQGGGPGHSDYMGVYAEMEARLRGLETRVEDLDDAIATPAPATTDPPPAGPTDTGGGAGDGGADDGVDDGVVDEDPLAFPTLAAWVEGHFVHLYTRPLGGAYRWCSHWWDHAEAIARLDALWRAWETLRLDPQLGMATWYAQYLDPQLPILLGAQGPFARCTEDRHEPSPALPVTPAPDGWWELTPAGITVAPAAAEEDDER